MPEYKNYTAITREELINLRKDLAKEGINIPEGDDVEIKGPFGIELNALYDDRQENLEVRIIKKPFYIPESEIWKIVDAGTAPYIK